MEKHKVTITIDDHEHAVQVTSDPSFQEIMTKIKANEGSPALVYALEMLSCALNLSRGSKAEGVVVDVPKLDKATGFEAMPDTETGGPGYDS